MKARLGKVARGIRGYLQDAVERVPAIPPGIPREVVGKTVAGRDIVAYRIGNGPMGIVFCGAIHGNEVGTAKLVRFLMAYLGDRPDLHGRFTFLCVPVLNVDGYALGVRHPDYLDGGRVGRFNANGVDLNRNFPTASFAERSVWSHGKDYSETTGVFCGSSPGSEPETTGLRALVGKEKACLLWMFHSVATEIMASHDPSAEALASLFAHSTGFRHATQGEWLPLGQTGTAKEWCEENGIMYLESEASQRWGSDWNRQKPGILAVLHALVR